MSKILNIVKGWSNVIKYEIGVLEEDVETMSAERLEVCGKCIIRNGNVCSNVRYGKNEKTGQRSRGCGCFLIAKTKVEEETCPLDKW